MLNESGAKLLFINRATRHMAEEVMTDEYSCPIVEEESFTDLTAEIDPEELLVHADRNKAGDWNTLRYTSGSTGTPKGMLLTHRSTELMTYNYINRIKGEIVAVNDEWFDDKISAIQKIEEIRAAYAIRRVAVVSWDPVLRGLQIGRAHV